VQVDCTLQIVETVVGTAVQLNDREFDGDELDPVAFRDRDSNRDSGVFDNLLFHNKLPRLCSAHRLHTANCDCSV